MRGMGLKIDPIVSKMSYRPCKLVADASWTYSYSKRTRPEIVHAHLKNSKNVGNLARSPY